LSSSRDLGHAKSREILLNPLRRPGVLHSSFFIAWEKKRRRIILADLFFTFRTREKFVVIQKKKEEFVKDKKNIPY